MTIGTYPGDLRALGLYLQIVKSTAIMAVFFISKNYREPAEYKRAFAEPGLAGEKG